MVKVIMKKILSHKADMIKESLARADETCKDLIPESLEFFDDPFEMKEDGLYIKIKKENKK